MLRLYYNGALSVFFASCLLAGVNCDADLDDSFNIDYVDGIVNSNATSSTAENGDDIIPKELPVTKKTSIETSQTNVDNSTPNYFPQFKDTMEETGCGFGYPSGLSMYAEVINASDVQFGEFSWTVKIHYDEGFIGTGTLIAPDIVLTAASLLRGLKRENLMIRAGEWDIGSVTEAFPHQDRSVKLIISHEKFYGVVNNIALLVVQMKFLFQPNIRTLCLPSPGTIFDYSTCKTTAWRPATNGRPQQTLFQIQPSHKCDQRLPRPYLRQNYTLDESVMCAIDANLQNSAILNSGASLFCPMLGTMNRYTQAGIVIGNVNRSESKTGLFVNLTHLMPWIFKQLGPRQTDLKYYLP
ncbi:phenoloxidase-activating factor 2-like [Drosophila montana]|uniref:phenoloxidase-activating factor 2-like n=1 Tax=Drosophila montana TaxID=40370 RepID=UPI00313EF8B2